MPLLTTHALCKRYGETPALVDLNLELGEGGIFGFLGPNGAGKTTTIRLLLGLLHPTSGTARIFGRDAWRESAWIKRETGYLPGDVRLYPNWNGRKLLKIFGRIRGRDLARSGEALAEVFELNLGLRAGEMSRGTRQKLGLVLALAHEPRLVILDEPTSGLDPIMQDRLKRHLRALAGRGHTVFFSSHTLSEVEQLCDRVAILRRGRMVVDTTLEELRARSAREVILRWSGAEPDPGRRPAGLEIIARGEGKWTCRWRGEVGPLLSWLGAGGAPGLEDVTIAPPDLENLFHEYYAGA